MTITMDAFWKGRDVLYISELTSEINTEAHITVYRANLLLDRFYAANPRAAQRGVNSGWRPPAVNAATVGAAKKSAHMLGKAIDIGDDDEQLDKWCMTPAGVKALTEIGLWMEHPSATPRWCHVQTIPPGSGKRFFYP